MRRLLLATLLFALGAAAPATAQLPIFDAHVHYSRPDWDVYSADRALAILRAAGVRRAIVSSTPDDGTLKLYERAPKTIVPFLRPYRTRDDMGNWHNDPGVRSYVEERLKRGIYRGIGEFHLSESGVGGSTLKRFAGLAADRDLFLQAGWPGSETSEEPLGQLRRSGGLEEFFEHRVDPIHVPIPPALASGSPCLARADS